jgi:benzodiazapine receptor
VVLAAIAQVVSAPITSVALGPSSNQATISDANISPVTPAGYAFAIWGLIYLASLAYAVYQLLPAQRTRTVHRRTGWWLVGAFAASTIWVPVFGTRTIWLSQLVILGLVACLAVATQRFTDLGPAETFTERLLLRLPVTFYLGWATLATAAGFGVTFRSLGMPASGGAVTAISLALVLVATIASVAVVTRFSAIAGFAFTACWALVAIAVATYVGSVRIAALVAIVVVLGVVLRRTLRSRQPRAVLLG